MSSSGKEAQLVGELALVRDDLEAALADRAELETALGLLDRNSKKQIEQLQVRAPMPCSLVCHQRPCAHAWLPQSSPRGGLARQCMRGSCMLRPAHMHGVQMGSAGRAIAGTCGMSVFVDGTSMLAVSGTV